MLIDTKQEAISYHMLDYSHMQLIDRSASSSWLGYVATLRLVITIASYSNVVVASHRCVLKEVFAV